MGRKGLKSAKHQSGAMENQQKKRSWGEPREGIWWLHPVRKLLWQGCASIDVSTVTVYTHIYIYLYTVSVSVSFYHLDLWNDKSEFPNGWRWMLHKNCSFQIFQSWISSEFPDGRTLNKLKGFFQNKPISSWNFAFATVDGKNPAPHAMYKTL